MSQQRTITIPAMSGANPGIIREPVSGRYFATISANGVFYLRPSGGTEVEQGAGRTYGSEDSPEFSALTFVNRTGAAVTLTYYYGATLYQPDSTTNATIGSVSVTVNSSVKNAPTYTKASTGSLAASGGTVGFTGLNGADVRKSFSVFNDHDTDPLYVRGANGTTGHKVPAQTGYPVETGGALTLLNPGGDAITYYVMEVFYS